MDTLPHPQDIDFKPLVNNMLLLFGHPFAALLISQRLQQLNQCNVLPSLSLQAAVNRTQGQAAPLGKLALRDPAPP